MNGAPPLVLLHSLGLAGGSFAPLTRRLADRRCVALDLPGHGGSPAAEFSIADAASAVVARIDDLGGPVDLLGVSLGGVVAQVVAATAGDRVRKLVLANTFARLPSGAQRLSAQRSTVAAVTDRTAWARDRATAVLTSRASRESHEAYTHAAAMMEPSAFLAAAEAVYAVDLRAAARTLPHPTLVVAGELDERTPLPAVRELAELIPDARLIVVPGAGHLAHLDRPDVVAAEIGDFLDGYMV